LVLLVRVVQQVQITGQQAGQPRFQVVRFLYPLVVVLAELLGLLALVV
jgi:hypothetical protein